MKSSYVVRFYATAAVFFFICAPALAQLVVVPNNNANALVTSLLTGSGIPFTNATYTGAATAAGTFTGGTSPGVGLGINSVRAMLISL